MGTIPLITSILDLRNLLTLAMFFSLGYLVFSLCKYSGTKNKGITTSISAFGLVLTVLPFLPASNLFFPVGFVVAERVLYLPSMGFCMLVGCGAWHVITALNSDHLKIAAGVTLGFLLLLHSVKTLERNRVWVSEETLYLEAVRTHPNNAKMLHNLATRVWDTDLVKAELLLRMAARVEPKYVSTFSDLGFVLAQQNKLPKAEEVLQSHQTMLLLTYSVYQPLWQPHSAT